MNGIEYIIGNNNLLEEMSKIKAWKPFDERVIGFCGNISKALLNNVETKSYPDLVTLAFWLRKSNIKKILQNYSDMSNYLGKGLVFHIAPGNVALSFAYSLATGLLTGNTNIIRLPSRKFRQADIFCEVVKKLLYDEDEMSQRICLIKYSHDKSITDELSLMCHVRIIWGGNETVNIIRQSPLMPRATDITFANRFSICVIDADKYLSDYEPGKTAHDFYIDTYLSDQNACSSPRIIFWLGEKIKEAKKVFWSALYEEISLYTIEPVTTVDKLLTFCKYSAENKCKLNVEKDCRIMRIEAEKINKAVVENIGSGGGLFYENEITSLSEILPICEWEMQTISYIGVERKDLLKLVLEEAPFGVDRVVPVGSTMNFSLVWDGRDVVREMTREISVT